MSEHEWFHDHLTLYSAGGLSADEASRLERHAAECAACAQELAQWRLFDQGLDRLCAPVQFAADWDERVLTRWRVTHKPPRRWSSPARWAAAAAAMVFIAVLGGAVNTVAQMGLVSFPGGNSVRGQANLPPILPVFKMAAAGEPAAPGEWQNFYYTPSIERTQSTNHLKQIGLATHSVHGRLDDIAALNGADIQNSNSIDYFPPSLALIVRGNSRVHTSISGGVIGGKDDKKEESALLSGQFAPFGSVNRSLGVDGVVSGVTPGGTLTPDLNIPLKSSTYNLTQPTGHYGRSVADGGTVIMGGITKRLDDLQKLQDEEAKDLLATVKDTHTGSLLFGANPKVPEPGTPPAFVGSGGEALKAEQQRLESALRRNAELTKPIMADGSVRAIIPLPTVDAFASTNAPAAKSEQKSEKANEVPQESGRKHSVTVLKSTTEYFNSGKSEVSRLAGEKVGFKDTDGTAAALAPTFPAGSQQPKAPEPKREAAKGQDQAAKEEIQKLAGMIRSQQAVAQPKPDPQVAQRKIIRTGDIEFEVDLFDNAVNQITKLIGAIPGAFVMTVNSDRLPNGKVKGSIVVRMPPEHLDKFVLDLRKDLAKTGELKSQRIGSQDVTKQYTDIESRLRAARAMEERLIKIIQNGKGEIKDLVAAERELGVWRTKIEESEGEIRYYNNQVGLSTLTITAFEKEIRMAAAMVVTEQVTMKIEADDVEKSLQAALTAVTEAKGRVTKSDLKQHAAGQLEAVLQFEVAPAAAGPMKDKLKQLGIVTHQDSQRLQQAEGGAAPMGEPIKSRTNDVQFNVTLYNVANIKPRQEFVLQIAVTDVAAEYQRLLELVLQTSGQVRVSQLDEKDKTNIFAQLDFDVPTTKRELFDKQLAALGDVVARNTTRAGPGETATDRKVGYRLTLKSVTSIPPRETLVLQAYSLDVPVAFKTLHQAALQAKWTVRVTQLDEQNKQNITAQLDFDVPADEKAAVEKLLDELGEVHSRTTNRVPPNEIATEKKVGYRLTLRSQIPPRETVALGLEVSEVERVAADLANLVRAAKGKVTVSQITQDAAGRAVAIQLFDVPLTAKDDLVKKFKVIGKVRAQKATQNLQAPEGKLATAHIDVTLTNLSPIVPADESLWGQVRTSLGYAFRLLSVSLMFVIVGICVILPWALLLWVAVKLVRRTRAKSQITA